MELGWEMALDTQQAPRIFLVAAGPEDLCPVLPVGSGCHPTHSWPH